MICPVSWPLPAMTRTSPRAQFGDRGGDRLPPVADLDRAGRRFQNGAANLRRILAARIVVGDIDEIGELGCDAAHQRPLAAVAVAAGAEHDRETPLGMRAQRASAPSPAHPAYGRNRQRPAAPVAVSPTNCMRPGTPPQTRQHRDRVAAAPRRSRSTSPSAASTFDRLEPADQRQVDVAARAEHLDGEVLPRRQRHPLDDAQFAARLVAEADDIDDRARGTAPSSPANSGLSALSTAIPPGRQQLGEQPPFRRAIRVHVAVVIEMVARQIGEGRRRAERCRRAGIARDRGSTPRSRRARRRPRPIPPDRDAARPGPASSARRAAARSGDDEAERAEARRRMSERGPDLAREMRHRGLPVRAGHRDDRPRLPPVEPRRQQGQTALRVRIDDDRHPAARLGIERQRRRRRRSGSRRRRARPPRRRRRGRPGSCRAMRRTENRARPGANWR